MFQSCPSGRGPVNKINSVPSNIPSNPSFNRAMCPCFSNLNLLVQTILVCFAGTGLLGLNKPSLPAHCTVLLTVTPRPPVSVLSPVCSLHGSISISFITACFLYATTVSGHLLFLSLSVPPFVSSYPKSSVCFQATEILRCGSTLAHLDIITPFDGRYLLLSVP